MGGSRERRRDMLHCHNAKILNGSSSWPWSPDSLVHADEATPVFTMSQLGYRTVCAPHVQAAHHFQRGAPEPLLRSVCFSPSILP